MARSILAVLAGWLTTGVPVILFDLVLMKLFPTEYREGQIPPDRLTLLVLAADALWSIPAGWVTAKIATANPMKHVFALILWGELMGLVSLFYSWGKIQWWYSVGLLILWIPTVYLGGRLATRR
jgi:hypothetical protein